jgi:site-specific recombinase XerD
MTLRELAADCTVYLVSVRGYSPATLDGYDRTWSQFRTWLQGQGRTDSLREFTDDHVLAFITELGRRGAKVNTIVVKLGALSTLAQYAMHRKDERGKPLLERNPTKAFDWPQMQETETAFLLPDELRAFLSVELPSNEALARDLLVDTGLRASELCRANVGDVVEVDGGWSLAVTVKGRGHRQRKITVPLSKAVSDEIQSELLARGMPRGDEPLLVNRSGKRYTRTGLQYIVVRTAKDAGIERARISPHKIRHTVNVVRKVGGMDAWTRSRLLGQSSERSQERYDHVVPGELRAAKDVQAEGLAKYLGEITGSDQQSERPIS